MPSYTLSTVDTLDVISAFFVVVYSVVKRPYISIPIISLALLGFLIFAMVNNPSVNEVHLLLLVTGALVCRSTIRTCVLACIKKEPT